MVTLFLSLAVIVVVAGLVGHLCSVSRPGARKLGPAAPREKDRSHIAWPGVLGDSGGHVDLRDTHHSPGWGHSHAHGHDSGGWGSGGFGGDSGGGGGGD